MQARTRALRLRQIRLAKIRRNANTENAVATAPKRSDKTGSVQPKQANSPAMMNVAQSPNGDVRFRVDDSAGSQVGSASISVVGPAVGETTIDGRNKAVGGVSTTTLRREIINRMIQENGWVVNDYQKQIGGRDVYVVVAQSQAKNGKVQSRMFYFTEVDGRIYNVATNSPVEEAERLAEESEKVINSLQSRIRPAQRASVKE
ncbi:MAG: hypothetical protein IPJ55_00230 [Chloracidobacterium sp.]|nr:hypothetical protein [Chloracidobacterium sp.]